jgi:hypothetical protein
VLHSPPISIFSIFITRTILGKEYRPFSFSLCNFLYSPVTSSPLGPNILLSTQTLREFEVTFISSHFMVC